MNEKQLEQQHVEETISTIKNEERILKEQQAKVTQDFKEQLSQNSDQVIRTGSDEAMRETAFEMRQHEQDLIVKYHSLASQEKRLKTLDLMAENPYFAKIDFSEDAEAKESLYLGIASLQDPTDEPIIVDWRAPIANLYYEGELGETSYESNDGVIPITLYLKRQFKIREGQILSMVDTSEAINDDFLLDILDEASSSHMKNIVSTIQRSQNEIIRDTQNKVLVVEGIAGSGKTSALLQRVAFLLYHNRKWLDNEQVLLFSPNHLFSDYISTVLPSLGESGIPTETYKSFLQRLLPRYEIVSEENQEEVFLTGKDDRVLKLKSSLSLIKHIKKYQKAITDYGPLFVDLKIKDRKVITKEQIRNWYHDANPQLPMYQRMSLLQTKLLKKLGGLQNDEMRQQWVKDLAEEMLQEEFRKNQNLDDSESAERKLRKKFARQIVQQKFKPLERRINNFQYVNYPKQYLHFLQMVPEKILAEYQLTKEEWEASNKEVIEHFRQKQLQQEDGTLLFLLMKAIFPIHVTQKARFIFIDEMQDFAPAQSALLQTLYPTATYTFSGDLNQKVFGNESMVHSLNELFPDQEIKNIQLTTSYRSTEEITDFANQFLENRAEITLTARKGDLPVVIYRPTEEEMIQGLNEELAQTEGKAKYWRTAIIAKTADACQELYSRLSSQQQDKIQLIVDEEDFMKRKTIIIPAYLAKGLEFDRVFVWDVGEDNFSTDQDRLILYTMCTRAMHELNLLVIGKPSPLLTAIDPIHYRKE